MSNIRDAVSADLQKDARVSYKTMIIVSTACLAAGVAIGAWLFG